MREWAWAGNTEFEILNVCSDQSVGRQTEDMSVNDAPFPVTSDPNEIAGFLQKKTPKVVFCTYQSSPLITDAQLVADDFTFDLAVADEAHRCAGKADAGFATILDGNKIRATKRLFTTATPRYFGKSIQSKAEGRGIEVVGMDDESIFGPVVHQLTFGEAIQRDLLTDYQVVVVGVDNAMVKSLIDERELLALSDEKHTDAESLAAKIGLIKACKDYDLQRIISFHSRINGAKEFSEEFTDIASLIDPSQRPSGVFLTDYVSGDMNAGDRKNKIDRLKGLDGFDRGILANARCLAEGVDVPALDGVAFIDPRGSQVEIIQAVGRAIRKVRGVEVQKKGTIVIPVFIQDSDTVEESIEQSNFKPVWDILKALRAHDEVLADVLDSYRIDLGRRPSAKHRSGLDKIVFDLPLSVDAGFSDALKTFLVEQSTESWEFWFGLLEAFKEGEGNCLVPLSFVTENGYRLGKWVSHQRNNYKKNRLCDERKQRLDELGFVWDSIEQQWEQGFIELSAYHREHGHCLVPQDLITESGYKLGGWASQQRTRLRQKKLPHERKQRLDALGFVWDKLEEQWEKGFRELEAYYREHGHCLVPVTFVTGSGFQLGAWIAQQRKAFGKDNLSDERKERLDAVGLVWDPFEQQWEEGFIELSAYHQEHGHCSVPKRFMTESGYKLGSWVAEQRTLHRQKKLSHDRKQRLDALGFVWNTKDEQWERGFRELRAYYQEHGDCLVPVTFVTGSGFQLGTWVATQRTRLRQKKLSHDRKQRLDALGFVWNPKDEHWERGLRELKAYYQEHGHCSVPKGTVTESGFSLGTWVANQRLTLKQNKLSQARKQRLDALGFVWDPFEQQWEEGFKELSDYHRENGHCLVPTSFVAESGFQLGTWVANQRGSLRQKKLSHDRKQRLDALGFVWSRT